MKSLTALLLLLSVSATAQEVLDLGKIHIHGKFRGPKIQVIESDRMSSETAQALGGFELKELEERLLQPTPAFANMEAKK